MLNNWIARPSNGAITITAGTDKLRGVAAVQAERYGFLGLRRRLVAVTRDGVRHLLGAPAVLNDGGFRAGEMVVCTHPVGPLTGGRRYRVTRAQASYELADEYGLSVVFLDGIANGYDTWRFVRAEAE